MTLEIGSAAPAFDLPTDSDGRLSLDSLRGKKVVLYFYPKDMTPGCTTESQNFRDLSEDFAKLNTVIVGASRDSVARHDKFKAKNDLNFSLLSDEEGTLCEAYGVWQKKKLYGKEFMGIVRTTFLIDEQGAIEAIWNKVRVKGHAEAVLNTVQGD